jgi:hypothetical protein
METVNELIQRVKTTFPEEYSRMIPCWSPNRPDGKHEWQISPGTNSKRVTIVDVECCHCRMTLANVLKFFVGTQDHG